MGEVRVAQLDDQKQFDEIKGFFESENPEVRMTIMTLRRKLGDPPVLETVMGAGYRI